ncbi:MAG: protein kinase [Myxococcales bacterium]|nr:protein kinase [Myxococcales bacterium]
MRGHAQLAVNARAWPPYTVVVADEVNGAQTGVGGASTLPAVASPSDTAAPTLLDGRYRLLHCIGRGGMGAVWAAEHVGLGTTVAVKLIHPSHATDERARDRFGREARAAASLRSPHVVQIFDHGVHDGTPYIAMELLDGQSLGQRLAERGRMTPDEVLGIIVQVCRAAALAHGAGVIHRDLKPDNVFLVAGESVAAESIVGESISLPQGEGGGGETAGLVKVLDFGIAKQLAETAIGPSTGIGRVLGTPYYMSPEQLVDAGTADHRADLWSIAVIAYECLVGRRPFEGHSLPELAVAVLTTSPPIPSHHADVPAGFDAWFARATARDPDARFPTAQALADGLRVAVRPVTPAGTDAVAQPGSSRRVLWIAIAGAAALTAVAIVPTWREAAPDPSRSPATAVDAQPSRHPAASSHAPSVIATPTATPVAAPDVVPTPSPTPPTSIPSTTISPRETTAPRTIAGTRRRPSTKPTPDPTGAPPKHDISELEP